MTTKKRNPDAASQGDPSGQPIFPPPAPESSPAGGHRPPLQAQTPTEVQEIAMGNILPSQTPAQAMRRKSFKTEELNNLKASIREHGVLQPLVVRRRLLMDQTNSKEEFELVAGERRWLASISAELRTVPCIVRDLDDQAVAEIQLIENLQREGLDALAEAEGYAELHAKHGLSAEQIAGRIGKSKAYVYARMKLCALAEPVRALMRKGVFDASTALLIARLPIPKLQEKAAEQIAHGGAWEEGVRGAMSYRDAKRLLRDEFMLDLRRAPFDRKSASLGTIACVGCPKRTGCDPDLFGDVDDKELCTDPACFAKKRETMWAQIRLKAAADGCQVLEGKETTRIFSQWGGGLNHGCGYVKPEDIAYDVPGGKSWKTLLGKHAPTPVVARDREGRPQKLLPVTALPDALKAAGVKVPKKALERQSGESAKQLNERQEREEKRQKERTEINTAVAAQLMPMLKVALERDVESSSLLSTWAAIESLKSIARMTHEDAAIVVELFELGFKARGWMAEEAVVKAVAPRVGKMTRAQQLAIVMLMPLLSGDGAVDYRGELNDDVRELAKVLNVDIAVLESQVKSERAANQPPAEAAKPATKKSKKAAKTA